MRWLIVLLLIVPAVHGLQLVDEGLVLQSTTVQRVAWTGSYFAVGEDCTLFVLDPDGTVLDDVQLCQGGQAFSDIDIIDDDTVAVTLADLVVVYDIGPSVSDAGDVSGSAAAVANGMLIVDGISYSLPDLVQLSETQGIEPLIGSTRLVTKDGTLYNVSDDGSLVPEASLPGPPVSGAREQGRLALTFASPSRLTVYEDGASFDPVLVRTIQQPCCPAGIGMALDYLAAGGEVWKGSEKLVSEEQWKGSAVSPDGVVLAVTDDGVRKYVVEAGDDETPDTGFPAPPPAPDPAGVPGEALLHMIIPGQVPPDFTAEVFHTGAEVYSCMVHQGSAPGTDPFTLEKDEVKQLIFEDLDEGTYVIDANCSSGNDNISTSETFEVIGDGQPMLLLGVPSQTESPFNVTIEHTADETLTCTIGIDLDESWGEMSDPFTLSPGHYRDIEFRDISDGIHTIRGECETSEGNITAEEDLVVGQSDFCQDNDDCSSGEACSIDGICVPAEGYSVIITEPPAEVNGSQVNVTYHHTALDPRMCIATIDSHTWDADDPRWDDVPVRQISPGQERKELFEDLDEGIHVASVFCTNMSGMDGKEDVAVFEVSLAEQDITDGVEITLIYPGSVVNRTFNVTFLHNASDDGTCEVRLDDDVLNESEVAPYTLTTYVYEQDGGTYDLAVECSGSGWLARTTRELFVNTTQEPDPALSVEPVLEEGEPFDVHGTGFVPDDDVLLYLVGGGTTVWNSTSADSSGAFSFSYPGLSVGGYGILAESASDDDVQAGASIDVRPPAEKDEPDDTPRIGPTDEQPRQVPDESDAVETDLRKAPQPRSPGPEPTATASEESEEGSSMWWIVLLLLFLVIGGLLGWLVYNGSLDVGSWQGFQDSLQGMFRGDGTPSGSPLASFIENERAKGFTDEQIREALVKKGWDEEKVDRALNG